MAVDYEQFRKNLEVLRGGAPSAPSRPAAVAPQSALDRYRQERRAQFAAPVAGGVTQKPKGRDDGFDAGDVFKPLGKLAQSVLRAVDAPRAAVVSGVRELADAFDPNEDASWSDFKEQFNRRAGAQELLLTGPHFGLDEKGWEDEILGFAFDVVLDPLTYTPGVLAKQAIKVGGKAAERTVAQRALKVAVNDGSSKMISKTVAANAAEAGIRDAPEIQKLIVLANSRGRGALTERGLREAGVTAAQREAIGLAAKQPGNARALLQFAENVKGGLKQGVRESAIGFGARKMFVPESMGRLSWVNDAFNKNLDFKRRAEAALATTSINPAKAIANKWGALTMKRAELDMMGTRKAKGAWARMSDDEAILATKNIEAGIAGEAEDAGRKNFSTILQDQRDAGVQVGDFGPNYVPHYETQQFVDWARKNPEEARFITSVLSKESFQQTRKLVAGKPFMDEILQEGTIDEINRIFSAKFGFKMLEDDLRVIMPRYIKSAERAMGRAKQLEILSDLGFSEPLATKLVKRTDPQYLSEIKYAVDNLKAAKQAQRDALKRSSRARKDSLLQLRDFTNRQKAELQDRVLKIEHELKEQERLRNVAVQKYQIAVNAVDAWRQRIVTLEENARNATGVALREIRAEIKAAKQKLGPLEKQAADALAEGERIMAGAKKTKKAQKEAEKLAEPFMARSASLTAERDAIQAQIDELAAEAADYQKYHDDMINNIFPPNVQQGLLNANDTLEFWLKTLPGAANKKDFAEANFLFVAADARHSIDVLNRHIGELDAILDKDLAKLPAVRAGRIALRNDLRDKFNTVKAVLERQGNDPITDAIAKLEAVATKADMDAWQAGNQVKLFERMLAATKSNGMEQQVQNAAKGMTKIGKTNQIPNWVVDATKIDSVRNQLPFFGKWGQRYFGLFKGYAILRPGFHVRNLYSAMFNMYLEAGAGSFKNVKKWHDFYTKATHDPEGYMAWARKKYGDLEAQRLDDAFSVISATGGGQAATEFSDTTFRKASKNPFDQNNAALLRSRRAGGWVEDHVRGAHAYDVLSRGGTVDQAVDVVTKWHFDYNDVTKFDQAMKLINPFWIFFSRNLALQSQTWLGATAKLNRTMINFERNANFGLQEDEVVPEYFFTEGATRLPFKGFGGESLYLFSDLPAMTFPGELDRLSSPGDARFFADLGPFLKIPFELAADKQLFSNVPIDPNKPAQLPFNVGNIPGISALGALPGFDVAGSGELVVNPELFNVAQSAFPGLGQAMRLAPIGSEKGMERLPYSQIAFWTGLGLSENTPRAQRGELLRRAYEEADRRERESRLAGL